MSTIKPADIEAFLETVEERHRADARRLVAMMGEWSGEPPALWGSMIGFGRYHYRYPSGREGESFLIGFSPRRAEFSIYLSCEPTQEQQEIREKLLAALGRHRMGKGCLYVKRLSDIDLKVLEALARQTIETLQAAWPSK